jgi:hypothetical protein
LNRDTLDQLKPQVTRKASSPKEVSEYMNRVQGDASDLYVLEQENHGRQVCSKDPVDIIVMEIGLKHL